MRSGPLPGLGVIDACSMRYALFVYMSYYPDGGASDFKGFYSSLDECFSVFMAMAHKTTDDYGGNAADAETMQIHEQYCKCYSVSGGSAAINRWPPGERDFSQW